MKKIWKYLMASALLLGAVAVTGCSTWDSEYQYMNEHDYTVSVRFDANGGIIGGKSEGAVVDVFKLSDFQPNAEGKVSIQLLDLTDDDRTAVSDSSATRVGYFLAGWYTERQLRVNDKGEALDEYGNLVSESKLPQGYTYGGRWDFEKDRLEVDAGGTYSSDEPQLTLYAAWIPDLSYEFYEVNADGTTEKLAFDDTEKPRYFRFPVWNDTTGCLDMNSMPARAGMTFVSAFMDSDLTEPAPEGISTTDYVDYEKGIALQSTISIYTTWKEGTWFRISTLEQFNDNSMPNGCYELLADLDFTDEIWAPVFAKQEFTGTIVGNGHTIRNVTVTQADTAQSMGGLFGALGHTAVITDVHFENITYIIEKGSRLPDVSFGVFAGILRDGARLEQVSVSGLLEIGDECIASKNYSVGLLFGQGKTPAGLTHEQIQCALKDPASEDVRFDVDEMTGEVTLTFAN